MPKCKGCGAEIKWIKTAKGKNMPIDAKSEKRYVMDLVTGEWSFKDAYTQHWATCPKAKDFKKP